MVVKPQSVQSNTCIKLRGARVELTKKAKSSVNTFSLNNFFIPYELLIGVLYVLLLWVLKRKLVLMPVTRFNLSVLTDFLYFTSSVSTCLVVLDYYTQRSTLSADIAVLFEASLSICLSVSDPIL